LLLEDGAYNYREGTDVTGTDVNSPIVPGWSAVLEKPLSDVDTFKQLDGRQLDGLVLCLCLCLVLFRLASPRLALPCFALPCLSCLVLSCLVLSCLVLSCVALSFVLGLCLCLCLCLRLRLCLCLCLVFGVFGVALPSLCHIVLLLPLACVSCDPLAGGYQVSVVPARHENRYICNETHYLSHVAAAATTTHGGEKTRVYFIHIPYARDEDEVLF
jgi:hypothetical protein